MCPVPGKTNIIRQSSVGSQLDRTRSGIAVDNDAGIALGSVCGGARRRRGVGIESGSVCGGVRRRGGVGIALGSVCGGWHRRVGIEAVYVILSINKAAFFTGTGLGNAFRNFGITGFGRVSTL